tara:strand:- start:30 stop:314 length:285 start_codon:yes stop_codon:yes gene_type:complete
MFKNSTGDIALYFELKKREEKLKKRREYNKEYYKTYQYPDLEARRKYEKNYYQEKCLKKNPNYIKRPYNYVGMEKGDKIIKMKKEDKVIIVNFN